MTIAKQVAGSSYPFAVRFVLFGSEEIATVIMTIAKQVAGNSYPLSAVRFVLFGSSRIHTPEDKLQWVESNLLGWSAEICIGLLDWLSSAETP